MALTRVVYTQSVEGNQVFTVPFPYLDADDVKVTVDGEPTTVTWNNSSVLSISPAPSVGAIVYIQRRTTSNELLVDFTDGSTLTERQLDLMAQQNFYLAQVPMKKGCSPEDVTKGVLYLMDQCGETGQALPITGGQVMIN